MTGSIGFPACAMTRKLIALLEDQTRSGPAERQSAAFADRLASLEIEAMASEAAPTTLTLIRIARETTALTDRIAMRPRMSRHAISATPVDA